MSKYIRTKDEILKLSSLTERLPKSNNYPYIIVCTNNDGSLIHLTKDDIIKQADTIEELCDNCVVITEAYRKVSSFYDCEYEIEKYKKQTKTNNPIIAIYGAIWTNKGLIYVAKMNEKGVLELL